MPLITPEEARAHVRAIDAADPDLVLKTRAAERAAMSWLNRVVYESQEALDAGRAAAVTRAADAQTAYDAALLAADALDDTNARTVARRQAQFIYNREMNAVWEMQMGMVIEEDVKIGMLLILGSLYLNREQNTSQTVNELPMGSYTFLWPYRVGLGI